MFGKKKNESNEVSKYRGLDELLLESEKVLGASLQNNLAVRFAPNNASNEVSQLTDNLNKALTNYHSASNADAAKYDIAISSMNLGFWDMTIANSSIVNNYNDCNWSNKFISLLGFSGESDFPNKFGSLSNRLHPEDKQNILDQMTNYSKSYQSGNPLNIECRIKLKNNTYQYFNLSCEILRDSNGTPIHATGLLKNIQAEKNEIIEKEAQESKSFDNFNKFKTELKNMLVRLEQTKEFNPKGIQEVNFNNITQQLLDNNSSYITHELKEIITTFNSTLENLYENSRTQSMKLFIICITGQLGLFEMNIIDADPGHKDSKFVFSDEFRHMFGFSNERDFPNELGAWMGRLHPDDVEGIVAEFAKFATDWEGCNTFDLNYRVLKKNGEYGNYIAYGAATKARHERSYRVVGALQDVSVHKAAHLERDTLNLRLRLLQNSINIALWDMTIDPTKQIDGDTEFWFSPELRSLLGYHGEKEFPNVFSSWRESLHPEDRDRIIDVFTSHIMDKSGRTPYSVEYRAKKKNGEYIWLKSVGSTLRDDDGVPIRVVGSTEDISNRLRGNQLQEHISNFSKEIDNMTNRITEVISATTEISNSQRKNLDASVISENNAMETKSIVASIKNIASETTILGINASIEAARSGEAGRGFKVVSEEIGKLAEQSKKSAELIEVKIKTIQDSGKNITDHIKSTSELIQKQADTMGNMKVMIDEINTMYNSLINLIKNMTVQTK